MCWPTARLLEAGPRAPALLSLLVLACLPPEKRPQGEQLLEGHDVRVVAGLWQEPAGLLIAFDQPPAAATGAVSARLGRLQLLGERDPMVRTLAPSWVPGWGLVRQGGLVFVTDQGAEVSSPAPSGNQDDLLVLDLVSGRSMVRVSEFSHLQLNAQRFVAWKGRDDYREARLGDLTGRTQGVGKVRSFSFAADGTAYFIRASDDSWMRVRGPQEVPELLMNDIQDFVLSADGRFALVDRRGDEGDALAVIATANLETRVLPGQARDCQEHVRHPERPWVICLGRSHRGPVHPDAPPVRVVELDRAVVRDTGAPPVGIISGFELSGDGRTLMVFAAGVMHRIELDTGAAMKAVLDGRRVVFLPDGTLLAVLADFDTSIAPPHQRFRLVRLESDLSIRDELTLPGRSTWLFDVIAGGPGEAGWAVYESVLGETKELTVAALGAGPPVIRTLANGVQRFSSGSGRVLALTAVSSQDRTGELRLYDLRSGAESLLGAAVLDFAAAPACETCAPLAPGSPVAFSVRTRSPQAMEGLWLHRLP